MNESELETQLLSLRPISPSPELEGRIASELGALVPRSSHVPATATLPRPSENRPWRFLPNLGWAAAGALAGVAVFAAVQTQTFTSTATSQQTAKAEAFFEPAQTEREVLSAQAAEILYDDQNEPAQVMRYSSLERHSWINRATGARVEIEMPREDLLLVPVTYQ